MGTAPPAVILAAVSQMQAELVAPPLLMDVLHLLFCSFTVSSAFRNLNQGGVRPFLSPPTAAASSPTPPPLHVDSGEGVGASRGDVGLGGVEGDVVDGLLAFLPVGGDLLNAGFGVQVPQTQRAVVT